MWVWSLDDGREPGGSQGCRPGRFQQQGRGFGQEGPFSRNNTANSTLVRIKQTPAALCEPAQLDASAESINAVDCANHHNDFLYVVCVVRAFKVDIR